MPINQSRRPKLEMRPTDPYGVNLKSKEVSACTTRVHYTWLILLYTHTHTRSARPIIILNITAAVTVDYLSGVRKCWRREMIRATDDRTWNRHLWYECLLQKKSALKFSAKSSMALTFDFKINRFEFYCICLCSNNNEATDVKFWKHLLVVKTGFVIYWQFTDT